MMGSDIEQDVMDPVTHAQTPPSHSIISQQVIVSTSHGDLTHNLSTPHLEDVDIESGRHLLRTPTSFLAQSDLEPIHTLFRTQTESDVLVTSTTACLSDIAGTTIVAPSSGIS